MARLLMGRRARSGSRGQILPLFVIFLTAMLLMMSLVLDASSALLMKREYQSAADAAALAAANSTGFQDHGCAASLVTAATAADGSVAANLPGYTGPITVSCVTTGPYPDIAVKVSLSGASPGFFSRVVGIDSFAVSTTATAINGPITPGHYSVMLLSPHDCPSADFSGSVSAIFHGSLYVNSDCASGSRQALDSNGASGSITFLDGAKAMVVGGVTGPKIASADYQTGVGHVGDPLASLHPPSVPSPAPARTECPIGSGDYIYDPGNYPHGIQLGSSERAFLTPGLYYLNEDTHHTGGLSVPAHAQIYSVDPIPVTARTSYCAAIWPRTTDVGTNKTQWGNRCTAGTCGVLLLNNPVDAWGGIMVTAGGATMLRPYVPGVAAYKNLLIWQLGTASAQPTVQLQGGSRAVLSGGIYVPRAPVVMGGGGDTVSGDLTVQFICWDLSLNGNPVFNFIYNSDVLPHPLGYGLVQ